MGVRLQPQVPIATTTAMAAMGTMAACCSPLSMSCGCMAGAAAAVRPLRPRWQRLRLRCVLCIRWGCDDCNGCDYGEHSPCMTQTNCFDYRECAACAAECCNMLLGHRRVLPCVLRPPLQARHSGRGCTQPTLQSHTATDTAATHSRHCPSPLMIRVPHYDRQRSCGRRPRRAS